VEKGEDTFFDGLKRAKSSLAPKVWQGKLIQGALLYMRGLERQQSQR